MVGNVNGLAAAAACVNLPTYLCMYINIFMYICRYRIDPRQLGAELTRYKNVRGHIFMIASLGDEAEQVGVGGMELSSLSIHICMHTPYPQQAVKAMPVGRAHLCLDTSTLPTLLKKIFGDELSSFFSSSSS